MFIANRQLKNIDISKIPLSKETLYFHIVYAVMKEDFRYVPDFLDPSLLDNFIQLLESDSNYDDIRKFKKMIKPYVINRLHTLSGIECLTLLKKVYKVFSVNVVDIHIQPSTPKEWYVYCELYNDYFTFDDYLECEKAIGKDHMIAYILNHNVPERSRLSLLSFFQKNNPEYVFEMRDLIVAFNNIRSFKCKAKNPLSLGEVSALGVSYVPRDFIECKTLESFMDPRVRESNLVLEYPLDFLHAQAQKHDYVADLFKFVLTEGDSIFHKKNIWDMSVQTLRDDIVNFIKNNQEIASEWHPNIAAVLHGTCYDTTIKTSKRLTSVLNVLIKTIHPDIGMTLKLLGDKQPLGALKMWLSHNGQTADELTLL